MLTGLLSGYAAWKFGFTAATAGALLFIWAMIALAFIDIDTFYLPDDITLPLVWAGLLFNLMGGYTDLAELVEVTAAPLFHVGVLWIVPVGHDGQEPLVAVKAADIFRGTRAGARDTGGNLGCDVQSE